MKNLLIVEGNSDKAFLDKLISLKHLTVAVRAMGGLSEGKLRQIVETALTDIDKMGIEKIGILIDQDDFSTQERLDFINKSLRGLITPFSDFNHIESKQYDENLVEMFCCLMQLDGKGELNTVLRHIKTQDSPFADCLETWRNCITPKAIKQSDFDDFWVSQYLHYDTCKSGEKGNRADKCSVKALPYIFDKKAHIFNLEHDCLDEIKRFLAFYQTHS